MPGLLISAQALLIFVPGLLIYVQALLISVPGLPISVLGLLISEDRFVLSSGVNPNTDSRSPSRTLELYSNSSLLARTRTLALALALTLSLALMILGYFHVKTPRTHRCNTVPD